MKKLLFAALFSVSFVPAMVYAGPPAAKAASEPTASTAPSSVGQLVAADFPTYDADKSGELNNAEFDAWMIAAKKQSGTAAPDGEWLAKAFTKADGDKSATVSAGELTAFLSA